MNKQIVLCDIETNDRHMTTWLDKHPKLKEGTSVSLADYEPETYWLVRKIYDGPVHTVKDFDFHRKWDNNDYTKHEGLGV